MACPQTKKEHALTLASWLKLRRQTEDEPCRFAILVADYRVGPTALAGGLKEPESIRQSRASVARSSVRARRTSEFEASCETPPSAASRLPTRARSGAQRDARQQRLRESAGRDGG